ncbi:MAG: squalene/phytoene synthase family protein [Verrucomicrobiota bacterium]
MVDTVRRWEIPLEHFEAFLHSMRMDLTVTEYATFDDLYEYVYGSAAVIGLQMVPILEPLDPLAVRPREGPRRGLPAGQLRARRRRGPRARPGVPARWTSWPCTE